MDVFVITNFRVFRVSGLPGFGPRSTPAPSLSRILDITVKQPSLGQLLRQGQFTFESAAQEQGLGTSGSCRGPGPQPDHPAAAARLLRKQPLPWPGPFPGQDGT